MLHDQILTNDQRVRAWIESGLLDVLLGLLMLGFGVGILTGMIWLGGIFLPAMLPALIGAQQSFAARLPTATESNQNAGQKLTFLGLGLVGLLSIGVGLMFFFVFTADQTSLLSIRTWVSDNFPLVMGIFWAALLAATGWIARRNRFAIYAGLAVALAIGTKFLALPFGAAPLATGCLVLLAGFIITISFRKTYPRPGGNS